MMLEGSKRELHQCGPRPLCKMHSCVCSLAHSPHLPVSSPMATAPAAVPGLKLGREPRGMGGLGEGPRAAADDTCASGTSTSPPLLLPPAEASHGAACLEGLRADRAPPWPLSELSSASRAQLLVVSALT